MSETSTGVRNRLLFLGLVLLVAIPLALVLRDVVRQVLVVPLLYLLWLGSLLFHAVPQVFFWALLLAITLFLAVRSLTRRGRPPRETRDEKPGYPGQVQVWTQRVYLMERGDYSGWYVAQRLRRLILEVLAHHERLSIEQIKQHLKTGELDASPQVRACLQAGLAPAFRSRGLFSRLWHRLRLSVRAPLPDLDLEGVVQFLENQLKIETEDSI